MKLELDLRKDEIKLNAYNPKSPIVEIGPITIYLNQDQTVRLISLLNHFGKAQELRR